MNLFESHKSSIDLAFDNLDEYINDNTPTDHREISKAFHENGYVETKWGTRFFRAINHLVADAELHTIEDYFDNLRQAPELRLGEPQGFCDNLEDAMQFVSATIHLAHYDHRKWIEHQPHHHITPHIGVWVVYEIEAPSNSVLWSTNGLRRMAQNNPQYAPRISRIMAEYGYQQEVLLDTSHAKVVNIYLYNSEEDEDQYTRV